MSILVTGATGFIGSHVSVELLSLGYNVILLDNLSNSSRNIVEKIEEITNKSLKFYQVDLLDMEKLMEVFEENTIDAVIHLAGAKSVGESVSDPIKYYYNNVLGLLNLCKVMIKHNVKNLVFSSSATVYGLDNISPLTENMRLSAINPYGSTKIVCEQILNEIYISDNNWSIEILRYFNPIGAHESGKIGESPKGIPDNIMPYISQVAIGKLPKLYIYGNDYDTIDGTGVRDYIHVVDLAKGHIKAMEQNLSTNGVDIYNLGTGKGYSVLELVETFQRISQRVIPYEIVDRRKGDVDICFADSSKAYRELNWKAEKELEAMCIDTWRWELNNE